MTVYLSFGHDYMLRYATISKTTPKFLQNLCRWLLLSPFSGLIASCQLGPGLGWRMGEFAWWCHSDYPAWFIQNFKVTSGPVQLAEGKYRYPRGLF